MHDYIGDHDPSIHSSWPKEGGSEMKVYELVDGAVQTVALYTNLEAARAHAADNPSEQLRERTVFDEYVPGQETWDTRRVDDHDQKRD